MPSEHCVCCTVPQAEAEAAALAEQQEKALQACYLPFLGLAFLDGPWWHVSTRGDALNPGLASSYRAWSPSRCPKQSSIALGMPSLHKKLQNSRSAWYSQMWVTLLCAAFAVSCQTAMSASGVRFT